MVVIDGWVSLLMDVGRIHGFGIWNVHSVAEMFRDKRKRHQQPSTRLLECKSHECRHSRILQLRY